MLWNIREKLGGGTGSQFDKEVDESVRLMIEWIADLRGICPIARWCYNILRSLFDLGEGMDL